VTKPQEQLEQKTPMKKQLPWWRRPVRMMRRDYIGDFAAFMNSDLDALARESKERWHINMEWVMATPGCAPGLSYQTLFNSPKFEKFPALGDFDMLRAYLPHARKYGVHLVPYVNLHWYSYDFAARHPGWEQVLQDGTPYGRKSPLYGDGTTLCVNGPWRYWAFEMIREVMRTGVEGCFLDGPVVYPGACYCEHCRRLFAARHRGAPLPAYMDWGDPLWPKFARFRSESWVEFMRGAQAAAREVLPDAVIFLNGSDFSPGGLATARDSFAMEKVQTFTGAEEFFHCTEAYRSPYLTLNLARFLSAGENPSVVFTHHTLSTWHYNPLPKAEMETALAQTVAGGANTWFAIFMDSMKSQPEESIRAVEGMNAFLEKHEAYYTETRSAADTAVLFSNDTVYTYVTGMTDLCRKAAGGREKNLIFDDDAGDTRETLAARREAAAAILDREYHGVLDAFNYAHVPVRALWDEHLTPEKLKGVRTLVLPTAACLSEAQTATVRRFVENGGGLIATFECGFYDEWGKPAARPAWRNFLGLARVEGAFAPSRVEEYWTLTTDRLPGLRKGLMLPRPLNGLKLRAAKDAETLALYDNPIGKAYAFPKGLSDYPAVLFSRRGKGRVLYVASPLFESFDLFHIDAHKELARALVELAGGAQVVTNAPGSLAVELREQPGRLLVHLLNVTSDMKRPMGCIIPLRDIELSLRATRFRSARCLMSGKRPALRAAKGRLSFTLPEIGAYEVVVLDK
jgi:hypothetical protein